MSPHMLSPLESHQLLEVELRRSIERNAIRHLLHQQEMAEAARARRQEFLAQRRFLRLYTIRHFLFRLAPRWAARLTL